MQLQIETVTTCNARCHFCVYPDVHDTRSGKTMPWPLFVKIIDEAALSAHRFDEVCLTGLAETTLDPLLVIRVAYVRAKFPEIPIWIFTNGSTMTPALLQSLKDAGLTRITFSLNAISQEQHERVMKLKGKFDHVVSMAELAISMGLEVFVDAVCDGINFTEQDMYKFYFRWGHFTEPTGHGLVVMQGNWAGDREGCKPFKPNEWCSRSTNQLYIMADGRVSACCFDPTGKIVHGDLKTHTLQEVYASPGFVQFREDHVNDKADKYDICAKCTRI